MGVHAYLGIDPSLRKTGLSLIIDDNGLLETRVTHTVPKDLRGTPRLQYHRTQLQEFVRGLSPIFTAIEGPSLYSVNRADDLGDLRGRLSLTMEDLGSPVLRVAPTSVKKFATGNGGASKNKMISAAEDFWNQKMTEDEADASWLAYIAYAYFSPEPLHGLTRAQIAVIFGMRMPRAKKETVRLSRTTTNL